MPATVTGKKRQANRSNAQRSTGPRTAAGKRKVALNAATHGLSVPLPASLVQSMHPDLASSLAQEGIDDWRALNLALKILEYERCESAQYQAFALQTAEMALLAKGSGRKRRSRAKTNTSECALTALDPSPEPIYAAYVQTDKWELMLKAIPPEIMSRQSGLTADERQWLQELRLFRSFAGRLLRNANKQHNALERYTRRASNQLIKALVAACGQAGCIPVEGESVPDE